MKISNYQKSQNEWINDNNVDCGSIVSVKRSAKRGELGWREYWVDAMNDFIGKKCRVKYIFDEYNLGILIENAICMV